MKIQKKLIVFVMAAVLLLSNIAFASAHILNEPTNPNEILVPLGGNGGGDPDPIDW